MTLDTLVGIYTSFKPVCMLLWLLKFRDCTIFEQIRNWNLSRYFYWAYSYYSTCGIFCTKIVFAIHIHLYGLIVWFNKKCVFSYQINRHDYEYIVKKKRKHWSSYIISVVLWDLISKFVLEIYFGVNQKLLIHCIGLLQLLTFHISERIFWFREVFHLHLEANFCLTSNLWK